MGGCLDKPKPKKSKIGPSPSPKPSDHTKIPATRQSLQQQIQIEQIKPKYRKMTINELLCTYRIQDTLDLSCKLEGPKYLSNLIDGSSRVLRVAAVSEINEKRLEVYRRLVGFDIFENEEGSLMMLDEYCSGEDLYETAERLKKNKEAGEDGGKELLEYLQQIVGIVDSFHSSKIWLGNLTLSSFRRTSAFGGEVRLVDFNLVGAVGENEKMGFAHKDSYEADYEFLGYLCQFLLSDQPPIFVAHKMQYVEFDTLPHSTLVQKLLKGAKCTAADFALIKPAQIIPNTRVGFGYKFRRDINKLLKMRRKRKAHNRSLYGQDAAESISESRFHQQGVYRTEAERIFGRIGGYITEVNTLQEEAFINYAGGNESVRRLKEVFLLTDGEKKMAELKQCLATIR